jgi:hypothetical protein
MVTVASLRDAFSQFFRSVAVGTLAGALAGLATGFGSRLAMRIAGFTARAAGGVTEAGFTVGEITIFGTISLCLFSAFLGIWGGLAYNALPPWPRPKSARVRGSGVGALFLVMFGPLVIESVNPDFRLIGFPVLNVVTFASLFMLFGAFVIPLADRFHIALSKDTRRTTIARVTLGAIGLLSLLPMGFLFARAPAFRPAGGTAAMSIAAELFPKAVFHGFSFRQLVLRSDQSLAVGVLLFVIVIVPAARIALAAGSANASTDVKWRQRVMYSIAGVPIIAGLLLTSRAIISICGGFP